MFSTSKEKKGEALSSPPTGWGCDDQRRALMVIAPAVCFDAGSDLVPVAARGEISSVGDLPP